MSQIGNATTLGRSVRHGIQLGCPPIVSIDKSSGQNHSVCGSGRRDDSIFPVPFWQVSLAAPSSRGLGELRGDPLLVSHLSKNIAPLSNEVFFRIRY